MFKSKICTYRTLKWGFKWPKLTESIKHEQFSVESWSVRRRPVWSGIPKCPCSSRRSSHSALSSVQEEHPPLCSSGWLFTVRCPDRTQQSWPAVWPTTAPRTPATAPTARSRCRSSRRRTPGTNGAKRWISSSLSSALRWTWEMFGGFPTYVTRTGAVSEERLLKPAFITLNYRHTHTFKDFKSIECQILIQ